MGSCKCGLLQKLQQPGNIIQSEKTFCRRFAQISADGARKKEKSRPLK
jgi:hypothetical protein